MKKFLLLSFVIFYCLENLAQETSFCVAAPGATTATPVSSTVCTSGIVTLSPNVVPASTITGITYQWQYSTNSPLGPFISISGATTVIYPTPQNTVSTWYQVVITCTNGPITTTSSPAYINVINCNTPCSSSPGASTATPVSSTVCTTGAVTLSPNVIPASTLTGIAYQWQYSTSSAVGPFLSIPGATTAIYTTPQNTVSTWYVVVMTCFNAGIAVTSSPAYVNVINCSAPCLSAPDPTNVTPVSSTVCLNGTLTLSPSVVPAFSLTGVTYQWQYSTISALGPYSSIAGATTAIYPTPQNTVTGWYQVVITCTNGPVTTTSTPAYVFVTSCSSSCAIAPGATTATPVSSNVCMNGIVTLSPNVVPSSSLTGITYQWQYTTGSALVTYSAIPGATTAIYPTPQNTVATWYRVVITCANGPLTTTSSPAYVNVINCTSPCFVSPGATTATPVSSTVCMNGIVTLSPSVVPASTVTGVSYQWHYSTNSALGPFVSISGATTAIYPTPQNTVSTWYVVVMTCINAGVAVTSSPAYINVINCSAPCSVAPGATTATPVSSTVCLNGTVTLSPNVVPAFSVTGITYQWQYSTSSAFGPFSAIAGATTAIYPTHQNTVSGWYQVVVTCTNGPVSSTSSPAYVLVTNCNSPCFTAPGATTATPVSSTVCMNGIVTLSPNVVPSSSLTGITYQWQYTTGSALGTYSSIAGATTAIYPSPQNTVATWYRVVVTCANGPVTTTSSPAYVYVTNCISPCFTSPGATTATPVSSTVCLNGIVTLSPSVVPPASVTGVTYQWQYSTSSASGPYSSIAGATTAVYPTPQNTVSTWYQVIMVCSNAGNATISSPAYVYVTNCNNPCSMAPGASTATPASNTVCMNGIVTLSPNVVPASNVTGITYQWQYSTNSPLGPWSSVAVATTAIYTTPQNTVTGWYQVVITCTNGAVTTTSSPAYILVTNCSPTSPCLMAPGATTATPASNTVCINGIVTLSPSVVPASTVTGITYQWQYATASSFGPYSSVAGATTAIYTTPPNTVTGWYQVVITCTNGAITTTSGPANVFVTNCSQTSPCLLTPGATTATPVASTICINGIVTLSPSVVPASTITGIIYQWQYSTSSALGPYSSIAGATTAIYTTPQNPVTTWYQVVITCTNGGGTTISIPAHIFVIKCNSTGIHNGSHDDPGFRIYPVPADQSLTVEVPGEDGAVSVNIYSVDGKIIATGMRDFRNGKLSIELARLETGVYVLEITSLNKQARKLFVIDR